jgi:hypothetical protein
MKECGAKTRAGTPCKRPAMVNGRCRLHGGLTPIKHGRYSKVLRHTIGEMRLIRKLNSLFQAKRMLEPYLDDKTKEGLEAAIERYAQREPPRLLPIISHRKDT